MAGVVVLDAGVLIGLYDSTDRHHFWALEVFRNTLDSHWTLSALTLAEVMVHPARAGRLTEFEAGIERLGIEVVAIDSSAAKGLAETRAQTRLRMPDVIVLHLAITTGATLATTDQGLAAAAAVAGLRVLAPSLPR